jgi:predicted kinase
MRVLILTRGLPGSNKSTFLREKGLEPYTISPDSIRLLMGGLSLDSEGKYGIPQDNDKEVWKLVYNVLEDRMKKGEFVVVDATNLDSSKFDNYKKLKDKYRYRVYMLDFSEVSLEDSLLRNKNREEYKQVPDYVIRRMDMQLKKQVIPGWIELIHHTSFDEVLKYTPTDLNEWKKIHHIGDIHGCYTVLKEYLGGRLKDDELYIFCGDYLERGIENVEIMEFLLQIYTRKNVIMLEGNHERYVFEWANDEDIKGHHFKKYVKKEFEDAGVSKKEVRKFYRKLRQMIYYVYGNKLVLVSHGGITNLVENLLFLSVNQYVKGVGGYDTNVDKIFTKNILDKEESTGSEFEYYQLHGHRNEFDLGVCNGRSFNLEGKVERGGHLRAVTLDPDGFKAFELKNDVFNEKYKGVVLNNDLSIKDYIDVLRNNNYIKEKDNGNGVSSFNFNNKVFYDGIWNNQTVKARGLHIDVINNEILAKSYDKFFNVGELEITKLESLEENLKFPVRAFEKENGFLGLVGVHKARSEFYISSKGDSLGKYPKMVRELFIKYVENKDKIKEYIKKENVTLVFEVIKHKADAHIIEYEKDELILLDIVCNKILFEKKDYEEVQKIANLMGIRCKKLAYEFKTFEEFKLFYEEELKEDPINGSERSIEGYVIEDSSGFFVKIKNPYYNYWKMIRGILNMKRMGSDIEHKLVDDFTTKFVNWADDKLDVKEEVDIITLRNKYLSM